MSNKRKRLRIRLRPTCPQCMRALGLGGFGAIGTGRCNRCGAALRLKHKWPWLLALCLLLAGGQYLLLEWLFPLGLPTPSWMPHSILSVCNTLVIFLIVHGLTVRFEIIQNNKSADETKAVD